MGCNTLVVRPGEKGWSALCTAPLPRMTMSVLELHHSTLPGIPSCALYPVSHLSFASLSPCAQVAAYTSAVGNSTELVTQVLHLPAGACAVITNGRLLWDADPRQADKLPPALIAEDFGLLQLFADTFQTGGALATFLKSHRASANKKTQQDGGASSATAAAAPMSSAAASTAVMVADSALSAQVYPDSRFGSLQAKQILGGCCLLRGFHG